METFTKQMLDLYCRRMCRICISTYISRCERSIGCRTYLEVVAVGIVSVPEEGSRCDAFIIQTLVDFSFLQRKPSKTQVQATRNKSGNRKTRKIRCVRWGEAGHACSWAYRTGYPQSICLWLLSYQVAVLGHGCMASNSSATAKMTD